MLESVEDYVDNDQIANGSFLRRMLSDTGICLGCEHPTQGSFCQICIPDEIILLKIWMMFG